MENQRITFANISDNGLKVKISNYNMDTHENYNTQYENPAPIHEDLARRIHELKPYLMTVTKVNIPELEVTGFQIVTQGDRKKVYFYAGIYDADGKCRMNSVVRVQVGDSAVLMPNLQETDLDNCCKEIFKYMDKGKRYGLDHGLEPIAEYSQNAVQPTDIQQSINFENL